LVILAAHVAVACESGEVVKARWTDGSFRLATIIEVRDQPNGECGQYRVVWHHNHICEDPTITGHDTRVSMNFCLVSRDAIEACKQELCRRGNEAESGKNQSGENGDSNRNVTIIVALVSVLFCCCCTCLCVQQYYGLHEDDEEKGMGSGTPATGRSLKSARSFWNHSWSFRNLTPKAATSSPMSKGMNKKRRVPGPSQDGKKMVAQPTPVAARTKDGQLQIAEKKHVQPEKGTGPNDPLCPPVMLQTHSSALRHTAQTYGGQSVPPPQSYRPPPQLPTLLQHTEGLAEQPPRKKSLLQGAPPPQSEPPQLGVHMLKAVKRKEIQHRENLSKPPPRKKPPLQGVPPQGTISEQAKAGPSSYKSRSQAPYFV